MIILDIIYKILSEEFIGLFAIKVLIKQYCSGI